VRENPELARRFQVTNIPAFVVVVDDREVKRSVGAMSEEALRQLCKLVPQKPAETEPKSSTAARVTANAAEPSAATLGEEATLPKSAPAPPPAENRGIFDRMLGKAPAKPTAPAARPVATRAQDGDTLAAVAQQPSNPLTATVRLRIRDAQGDSFGTGTIIDSRPGQTLILTCGHIFQHWTQGSQIHVDLFCGDQVASIRGKRVAHSLNRDQGLDVGLISIPTDRPLPACRVAPPGTKILVGTSVASVGCGGGEKPTVQRQKVTALNRFQGADNIECSAVPVEGRSGGGLFNRGNQVIGICMCADPQYREGLYAGLKTIHSFLDRQKLSHLYQGESAAEEELNLAAVPEAAGDESPAKLGESDESATNSADVELAESGPGADDRKALQSMTVTQDDVIGSEVVIFIRGNGQPGAPSKVVRLHRASRGFWEHLLPELDTHQPLQETSLKRTVREPEKRPARREARRPVAEEKESVAEVSPAAEPVATGPAPYRRKR
ncbi:MAG TPA: trypsin-like peptidase domain-containing protein, partial [Planctomycetaceae bacterium]|nr:trypsin-like peptidase domain-containing protein [Planctomycetaceae bacterium]